MDGDKDFLTYKEQMRHLRRDKSISCSGENDKAILCRYGYFNLVNGYKTPFVGGKDTTTGKHHYMPGTNIQHLYFVKKFDDNLRSLLLKYLCMVQEEVQTVFAYKFDELNNKGVTAWYQVEAFDTQKSVAKIVSLISKAYHELSCSKAEYVDFYMKKHKFIPMWILIKCINFSTLVSFVEYSKKDVRNALCNLYGMKDDRGYCDHKLLIGSLQWMRIVRNACAHNERIYTLTKTMNPIHKSIPGRIKCKYLNLLPASYATNSAPRIMDLLVYFKYYLSSEEYNILLDEFRGYLTALQAEIPANAFDYVRGQLGLKDMAHLQLLKKDPHDIQYVKF